MSDDITPTYKVQEATGTSDAKFHALPVDDRDSPGRFEKGLEIEGFRRARGTHVLLTDMDEVEEFIMYANENGGDVEVAL